MPTQEHELNESAFRHLEESIKQSYPFGHYIAIADGAIVGDAGEFMALHLALKAEGRDPREVLIVQAGHVYSKNATIFSIWKTQ